MPAELNKGAEIRFKGGKYKGLTGWYDLDKQQLNHAGRMYVIVKRKNRPEKATYVLPRFVKETNATINNYVDAMFRAHPDIEGMMEALAEEIAKCNITSHLVNNSQPLFTAFENKMASAIERQRQTLKRKRFVPDIPTS